MLDVAKQARAPDSRSTLLSVEDLQKTYKTRHGSIRAVDNVSFEISEGETVALVGESGCGKSTIALALLRLIDQDGGRVVFDGKDLDLLSPREANAMRRQLSIVFQNPYASLNPRMRIRDVVGEPIRTAFDVSRREREERIAGYLRSVGLGPEHMSRFPHEFSGGQRQRIAVARALALEPRLLILDEPTAALDVSVQAQVLNLLRELQTSRGLSFLYISHDLATVECIADRVLVMYLGRIVEAGRTSEVFARPAHPYTRALLDSIPIPDPAQRERLKPLGGEVPSPLNPPSGCAFHPRCGRATAHCTGTSPSLELVGKGRSVSCFHNLLETSPDPTSLISG